MAAVTSRCVIGLCAAQELTEETIAEVLGSLQYATEAAEGWAKAWHNWALFNVQVSLYLFWCVLLLFVLCLLLRHNRFCLLKFEYRVNFQGSSHYPVMTENRSTVVRCHYQAAA